MCHKNEKKLSVSQCECETNIPFCIVIRINNIISYIPALPLREIIIVLRVHRRFFLPLYQQEPIREGVPNSYVTSASKLARVFAHIWHSLRSST